jgi:hypothetical protein
MTPYGKFNMETGNHLYRAIYYGYASLMTEDSLGDGDVLIGPLRAYLLQTQFRPLEFLSTGPATSGDSLHLFQKTAKSSKSYEPIVAKCFQFQ